MVGNRRSVAVVCNLECNTAIENLKFFGNLINSGETFPDSIGPGKLWLLRLFKKKEKIVP
jgi:hypothetical protein